MYFRLLGTNGSHVKAEENVRFSSAGSRVIKYENFTKSFGKVRQKIAPKSVPYDYLFLVQPIMSQLISDMVAFLDSLSNSYKNYSSVGTK